MRLADALAANVAHVEGEPAPVLGGWEIIGPPGCPILGRRTLIAGRLGKLLWHRFLSGASDRDPHDHPRSFVTIVLRGGYDDESVCVTCEGEGVRWPDDSPCGACGGTGRLLDRVYAPAVRFRRASHAHVTRVGPSGATTLVVMGPQVRAWGFWRHGQWWPWRAYERRFGLAFRCEDENE